MLPNPNNSETSRVNEELNQLLQDLNTLPEGTKPYQFDNIKFQKISNFLASERSVGINVEDFVKIIKGAEFKDDRDKQLSIDKFLESERSAGINVEDFVKIIKSTEIKNGLNKKNLIQNFLKSERSVGINVEDFVKIIKSAEFKEDCFKKQLIDKFLESKSSLEVNAEDFVKIIKSAEFKEDCFKEQLINKFLESKSSLEINAEDFVKIIKSTEIKNGLNKKNLIQNFLKSERSSNMTPQDLVKIIKGVGLQNRPDLSTNLYVTKFSASENYIENFIDFTKALHPSEAMQCEFVKEFIIRNGINQNNVMGLKPFIEGLQDNDLALDLIDNLSRRRMLVDEKDTLSLVKNRSQKQYAFLTEIVGNKDLSDCISEAGIATLKATFGNDLKVGDQSITVSDLISYYDLKNQTPTLFAMLKPEFKKQLRDNFAPSAQMLLYKPEELKKLNSLLGKEGEGFAESYFIENTILSAHLKAKVGNISEIDSSKTYQINFTNFGFDNSSQDHSHLEKQVQTNALFNSLLQSQDPNKEGVAKFFSDLLGIDLSVNDGEKLTTFFQQNKKELAHCFCNENLPKENFESLLTTLRDGCFANIGAQFKKMLYATMIKDEEAQILYAVADDKIFSVIINTHGSDIMVGNFSPINNEIINSYLLSPMALVKITSEEEMLANQKTWEIIGKNAGEDKKNEIYEKLSDSYPDIKIFNQKAKEIASFLIVKNVVGEEKMTGLENKNPQLKKLGDLVYGRVQEASIVSQKENSPPPSPSQEQAGSPPPSPRIEEEVSPPPSPRSQQAGSPLPSPSQKQEVAPERRDVNDSPINQITSFLSTGYMNLDNFFKNISREVERNPHLQQFGDFINGGTPSPLKEEEQAPLQRTEQAPLQRMEEVDSPSFEQRSQAESPAGAVMKFVADQVFRIEFLRPPF